MDGSFTIIAPSGERVRLPAGQRADALAALLVAFLKRPHLEDAAVWHAEIHVSPGQYVPRFGDSDLPTKRKNLKEAS